MLLHGLQQGTLYLGWGTVDLVGEDEVREDWAFLYLEVLFPLAIHECPYDVCWQEVGGELDALVVGLYELCQSLDRQGLGETR